MSINEIRAELHSIASARTENGKNNALIEHFVWMLDELEKTEVKNNGDRMRHMSNEELIELIYDLQGNAVACPKCYKEHGKERIELWINQQV